MIHKPEVVPAGAHRHRELDVLRRARFMMKRKQPEPSLTYLSPYKGLNPYSEADADIFFGRTRDTQRFVNSFMAWRLTVLYGESGVGKSSVLRAGVVHALREIAKQNIENYGVPKLGVSIFPPLHGERFWQDDPLKGLIQQIADDIQNSGFDIQPPEPGLSFLDTLQAWTIALGHEGIEGRLCIILDQFEEYFQYHLQDAHESFITEISKVLSQPNLRVNFLISLREDAYAKLNRLRPYIPDILEICLHIEHLEKQSARAAITQPIEKYNQTATNEQQVEITSDLVDALLQGIPQLKRGGNGRAGLEKLQPVLENQVLAPYLQLVMTCLWDEMVKAQSHCLDLTTLTKFTSQTVERVRISQSPCQWIIQRGKPNNDTAKDQDDGGIIRALETIVQEHVNRTMQSLSPKRRKIAARSFQYLVTPSGTKYAYSIDDLASLTACQPTELADLFQQLASEQRIVRPVGPSPDKPDEQRYEIFHDFLSSAVLDWQKQYMGRQSRKRAGSIGLASGVFITLSLAVVGFFYRIHFDAAILNAQRSLLQFENKEEILALQEAVDAAEHIEDWHWIKYTPLRLFLRPNQGEDLSSQASVTLHQILSDIHEYNQFIDVSEGLQSWDVSPDGQTLAIAFDNGMVRVWNLKTGRETPAQLPTFDDLQVLSFSPDNLTLIALSTDGTVQRWNWQTGVEQGGFETSQSVIDSRFSPIEPVVGIVSSDDTSNGETRTIEIWNWQTGARLASFPALASMGDFRLHPTRPVVAIATGKTIQLWNWQNNRLEATLSLLNDVTNIWFSPNGQALVIEITDNTTLTDILQIWDGQAGSLPMSFKTLSNLSSLSFNSNGQQVATGLADGTVQVWDWTTGSETASFTTTNAVTDLRFGFDDQTIVTHLADGSLSAWSLQTQNQPLQIRSPEIVESLRFSPDDQILAAVSIKGEVILWNRQTGNLLPTPFKPSARVTNLLFSPTSEILATATQDGTIQLWDWKTGNEYSTLTTLGLIRAMSFSPDGEVLVVVSAEGTVQVWDWQNQEEKAAFDILGIILNLQFNPQEETLAVGLVDGRVQIWNWQTDEQEGEFSVPGQVMQLGFSDDGQTLAVGLSTGMIERWQWRKVQLSDRSSDSFPVPFAPGSSLSFSADGQTLVTSSANNTTASNTKLDIWDLTGNQLAQFEAPSPIATLALSADGHRIATGLENGEVWVWTFDSLDDLLDRSCDWLHPYLESHPEARKELSCPR